MRIFFRLTGPYKYPVLLLLFLLAAPLPANSSPLPLSKIILLPTVNSTSLEVWESKYYPVNVLEKKMTEYLATLLRKHPLTDVVILDDQEAALWLANPCRPGEYALQMEIFNARLKEREVLGTWERGNISLRMKVYTPKTVGLSDSRVVTGQDTRYTFDPVDDRFYFFQALGYPVIFKNGLDFFRLAPAEQGQKMSRPTWDQFSSTSGWSAFQKALSKVVHELASTPDRKRIEGRIIAYAPDSTREKRKFIISLGRENVIRKGDRLSVVRETSCPTADPANPVVILREVTATLEVLSLQQSDAVAVVLAEDAQAPVEIMDIVEPEAK